MNILALLKTNFATAIVILSLNCLSISHAAVSLDGTANPAYSGNITPSGGTYWIYADYGQRSGDNLFHSFGDFGLSSVEGAAFIGHSSSVYDPSIANIISRVTGGSVSSIDGWIDSASYLPNANFFFINPNGIVFGPNASLNVGGSFHASTADYLKLGTTGVFYSDPGETTVLSSEPPSAFGFLTSTPAAISVQGSYLRVPDGETLSLIGGDIDVSPLFFTPEIYAYSGKINLVSAGSVGEIGFASGVPDSSALSQMGTINLQDATLSVDEAVSLPGTGAGDIYIQSGVFTTTNTLIAADTVVGNAGTIAIESAQVNLDATSWVRSDTYGAGRAGTMNIKGVDVVVDGLIFSDTYGTGRAGVIDIEADSLLVGSNGWISSDTLGTGNAGSIVINAGMVTIENYVSSDAYDVGDAGTIDIQADSLSVSGWVSTDAIDEGNAGSIYINAGTVDIESFGFVSSDTSWTGNAGTIDIQANQLTIHDFGYVSSDTYDVGNAGSINIQGGAVTVDGYLSSDTSWTGHAGSIDIQADSLSVGSFASISSDTNDEGNAGSIAINAGMVDIEGYVSSDTTWTGDAGSVGITAGMVNVSGALSSDTYSAGNAGSINVVSDILTVQNGGVISSKAYSSGNAGSITINATNKVAMSNGSTISVSSTGTGLAGNIFIDAGAEFLMYDSLVSTEAFISDGGNVEINATDLVYLLNSTISATVFSGFGGGGNITIDPIFVILDNSQIIANAFGGPGGNIFITTDYLFTSPSSVISASSALGIDGTVNIDSPETDVSSGLAVLSGNFLKTNALSANACAQRGSGSASTFVVRGQSGMPVSPGQPHSATMLDLVPVSKSSKPEASLNGVQILNQGRDYTGNFNYLLGCSS